MEDGGPGGWRTWRMEDMHEWQLEMFPHARRQEVSVDIYIYITLLKLYKQLYRNAVETTQQKQQQRR